MNLSSHHVSDMFDGIQVRVVHAGYHHMVSTPACSRNSLIDTTTGEHLAQTVSRNLEGYFQCIYMAAVTEGLCDIHEALSLRHIVCHIMPFLIHHKNFTCEESGIAGTQTFTIRVDVCLTLTL